MHAYQKAVWPIGMQLHVMSVTAYRSVSNTQRTVKHKLLFMSMHIENEFYSSFMNKIPAPSQVFHGISIKLLLAKYIRVKMQ